MIVGCGFGGLSAARKLAGADLDVLLIDRNNYHGFWPLLYQVATAGLEPEAIAYPARAIVRKYPNVAFLMAEARGVAAGGAAGRVARAVAAMSSRMGWSITAGLAVGAGACTTAAVGSGLAAGRCSAARCASWGWPAQAQSSRAIGIRRRRSAGIEGTPVRRATA